MMAVVVVVVVGGVVNVGVVVVFPLLLPVLLDSAWRNARSD